MSRKIYSSNEVAPNINEILKTADELQSGCFICIHGYRNSDGETADYWLNYGRDYVRIKENFIEKLKAILWKNEPFTLDVSYSTWLDEKGEHAHDAKPRKTKDGGTKVRIETPVVHKGLTVANSEILAGVLRKMLRTYAVRQMRKARSGTAMRFGRLAKGIYIDSKNNIHFRMSTLVWKVVRQPSGKRHYSTLKGAIGQAVRDKFLKMKAFKLGQFESMSIGGRQLLWTEVAAKAGEQVETAEQVKMEVR